VRYAGLLHLKTLGDAARKPLVVEIRRLVESSLPRRDSEERPWSVGPREKVR
jgi:hypothetical protein